KKCRSIFVIGKAHKFQQMKDQISVSIVEDMADVRQKIKSMIEESEEFICLSTYSNAENALEELPALKPDIVLMDINLPGMNGIECIKTANRFMRRLPQKPAVTS